MLTPLHTFSRWPSSPIPCVSVHILHGKNRICIAARQNTLTTHLSKRPQHAENCTSSVCCVFLGEWETAQSKRGEYKICHKQVAPRKCLKNRLDWIILFVTLHIVVSLALYVRSALCGKRGQSCAHPYTHMPSTKHTQFPWVSDTTTLRWCSMYGILSGCATTIQSLQYLHFESLATQKQRQKQNKTLWKTTCKDPFALIALARTICMRPRFYSISRGTLKTLFWLLSGCVLELETHQCIHKYFVSTFPMLASPFRECRRYRMHIAKTHSRVPQHLHNHDTWWK